MTQDESLQDLRRRVREGDYTLAPKLQAAERRAREERGEVLEGLPAIRREALAGDSRAIEAYHEAERKARALGQEIPPLDSHACRQAEEVESALDVARALGLRGDAWAAYMRALAPRHGAAQRAWMRAVAEHAAAFAAEVRRPRGRP